MSRVEVVRRVRERLRGAGLEASLLVRDLASGEELAIEPDAPYPLASLVKLPLAVAVLQRAARGQVHLGAPLHLAPGPRPVPPGALGPPGTSVFHHPTVMAADDLLHLAVSLSDNRAADALFALVPPRVVDEEVRALGVRGLSVRRDTGALTSGGGEGGDAAGNTGTARALADLLRAVWSPRRADPGGAARVRELLGASVHRQRLAPDFATDDSRWSSKTGTAGHLRHEVGVVEHRSGEMVLVCALSRSTTAASHQSAAEAVLGGAARALHDVLLG